MLNHRFKLGFFLPSISNPSNLFSSSQIQLESCSIVISVVSSSPSEMQCLIPRVFGLVKGNGRLRVVVGFDQLQQLPGGKEQLLTTVGKATLLARKSTTRGAKVAIHSLVCTGKIYWPIGLAFLMVSEALGIKAGKYHRYGWQSWYSGILHPALQYFNFPALVILIERMEMGVSVDFGGSHVFVSVLCHDGLFLETILFVVNEAINN
ncbi:hypothetical protein V6N11_019874 [Hibiscus sabdariffa]|uniref:Uncharacterized protein n=2 Tax=Hibiscus sabdariffa TaxID=183260 RepID=A0ABR2B7X0_9ROSI